MKEWLVLSLYMGSMLWIVICPVLVVTLVIKTIKDK